jgi:hypothetical protein
MDISTKWFYIFHAARARGQMKPKRSSLVAVAEKSIGAARERMKSVQSKFQWLPCSRDSEQRLPTAALEEDSMSTFRCSRRV